MTYLLYESASPLLSRKRATLEKSEGKSNPKRMKKAPDTKPITVPSLSALDCFMLLFLLLVSPKFCQAQREHGA